jgi:uncharacterized membrane protein
MKFAREFLVTTLAGGLLIVLPIHLTVLVLLKGVQSAAALVRPRAMLLPAWLPAENFMSLVLVLVVGTKVR